MQSQYPIALHIPLMQFELLQIPDREKDVNYSKAQKTSENRYMLMLYISARLYMF